MTYKAFPIPAFSAGLNLQSQPDILDPAQALDCLNTEYGERGAARQRAGFAKFTTSALTNQPDSLHGFQKADGTKRLIVGNGNRLDALDTAGASVANSTAPTSSPHWATRFGGPTIEATFLSNGVDQVRQYDTTSGFTTPAGLSAQTGKFVATWEKRLVVARESGTTAGNNPSSVNFSDPGDPTNFAAGVFEDLDPGDGEAIMGIATYREQLIVLKETAYHVFYGVGTDAAGEADPRSRAVKAGVGLAASKALAVARDGVYFLSRQGVYRTSGGEPELVSSLLDPFFTGSTPRYFRSSPVNRSQIANAAMWAHNERIYLSLPTGSSTANDRTLVFDPRYGWWSLYDLPAAAGTSWRPGSSDELIFAASAATSPNNVGKHICRHSESYTADNMAVDGTGGAAISSRWRGGWLDCGDRNVKVVREVKAAGEGECTLKLHVDWQDAANGEAVSFAPPGVADLWSIDPLDLWTLGASDIWAEHRQPLTRLVRGNMNREGMLFSLSVENSALNATWALHRADLHLRDFKTPSAVN